MNTDDDRFEREITADLETRQAMWQATRESYVRTRGEALFASWMERMRQAFRDDAAKEHDDENEAWTFARVAELRLRQVAPKAGFRAKWVERLTALHEEKQAHRRPEMPGPYAARPGTVLGTQGRQA